MLDLFSVYLQALYRHCTYGVRHHKSICLYSICFTFRTQNKNLSVLNFPARKKKIKPKKNKQEKGIRNYNLSIPWKVEMILIMNKLKF